MHAVDAKPTARRPRGQSQWLPYRGQSCIAAARREAYTQGVRRVPPGSQPGGRRRLNAQAKGLTDSLLESGGALASPTEGASRGWPR